MDEINSTTKSPTYWGAPHYDVVPQVRRKDIAPLWSSIAYTTAPCRTFILNSHSHYHTAFIVSPRRRRNSKGLYHLITQLSVHTQDVHCMLRLCWGGKCHLNLSLVRSRIWGLIHLGHTSDGRIIPHSPTQCHLPDASNMICLAASTWPRPPMPCLNSDFLVDWSVVS